MKPRPGPARVLDEADPDTPFRDLHALTEKTYTHRCEECGDRKFAGAEVCGECGSSDVVALEEEGE